LTRLWPRVSHQRCWAHKLRNLENKLKVSENECLQEAKLIYQADNGKEALKCFNKRQKRRQARAPKAVACLAEDLEELLAFFECPKKHWRRIRTTNVIERLFVEVRRRIRTMCAFTTRTSCERILFAVFNVPMITGPFTHSKIVRKIIDAILCYAMLIIHHVTS
jgi:putative transposase